MTFPTLDHSTSWDRTLPKPPALLHNTSHVSFGGSRSSSLLQHHIVPDKFPRDFVDTGARRNTVPCVAYLQRPRSPEGVELVLDETLAIAGNGNKSEHLTRKRAASHMAEGVQSGQPSPSSPNTADGASQFCLCQPEAKIPRPRNAFILYRQHQQASVVAQHPGLPNPDISKIIGEQWRSLPAKTKNEWKALAEDEKARHQQQYPDYRYQPRRNGRYSNQSSISGPSSGGTADSHGNCVKCGGKMMNPPSTSYSPYTPVTPVAPQVVVLPPPSRRQYTVTTQQTGRPQMQQTMISPQSARVRSYAEVFGRPAPVDPRIRYSSAQPPPTPMILDSPDPKRRRFNGNGVFVPAPGQVYNDSTYQYSPRTSPFSRPEAMQPRATMAPPSRTVHTQPPPPQLHPVHPPAPQARRDLSLKLPPLKTSASESAKGQSQKSGIEAMIMSIPVLNKIKILGQISPHLAAPGLITPPHDVRGAIIAVEGMDLASVFSMTNSIAEHLEKEGTFAVRIFGGPDPCANTADGAETMTTETFLRTISEWHKISREMVQYMTTKPGTHNDVEMESRRSSVQQNVPESVVDRMSLHQVVAEFDDASTSQSACETNPQSASPMDAEAPTAPVILSTTASADASSPVSPRTINQTADLSLTSPMTNGNAASAKKPAEPTTPTATPSRHPSTSTTEPAPVMRPEQTPSPIPQLEQDSARKADLGPARTAIPIAIVPHYQLTTVDASSISMPITDSYSPLNHWTWLASLWRGCVGPDVTVVIRSAESDAESSNGQLHQSSNSNNMEKVECRLLDCRSIVVNTGVKEGGDAGGEGGENNVAWEKAKRRVGFEVEEFLRK